MGELNYEQLLNENDIAIAQLKIVHQLPEVSRYISISDNYFYYVTNTYDVYFYKIYNDDKLIGSIHLEKQGDVLFMEILVFPEFQGNGVGKKIVRDIQNDVLKLGYKKIEISIDETNSVSLKLFKSTGFTRTSKDGELINFVYQR